MQRAKIKVLDIIWDEIKEIIAIKGSILKKILAGTGVERGKVVRKKR